MDSHQTGGIPPLNQPPESLAGFVYGGSRTLFYLVLAYNLVNVPVGVQSVHHCKTIGSVRKCTLQLETGLDVFIRTTFAERLAVTVAACQ